MSKILEFEYFSKEVKDFFSNLSNNNTKQWFDNNRPFYEKEIRDKSKAMIAKMSALFFANNLPFISDPKLSLFRINRDIRFSANKDPYKTNMGFFFPYSESQYGVTKDYSLGFYIHFEVGNSFIACGIHNPPPPELKKIRQFISTNYEELFEIVNDSSFSSNFPETFSMQKPLSRVAGYSKDHPAYEFLLRKDYSYGCKIDDNIFYDNRLPQFIIDKSIVSQNYLNFLYKTLS